MLSPQNWYTQRKTESQQRPGRAAAWPEPKGPEQAGRGKGQTGAAGIDGNVGYSGEGWGALPRKAPRTRSVGMHTLAVLRKTALTALWQGPRAEARSREDSQGTAEL